MLVGLTMERSALYARINERCERMVEQGLVEEARGLEGRGFSRSLNALNTVGYAEAFAFLSGEMTAERMLEVFGQNSRRYAKRQLTWFRRDGRIVWLDAGHAGRWNSRSRWPRCSALESHGDVSRVTPPVEWGIYVTGCWRWQGNCADLATPRKDPHMKRLLLVVLVLSLCVPVVVAQPKVKQSLFINLTSDDIDRASMAINLAHRVLKEKKIPVTIWLNVDAVRLVNKQVRQNMYNDARTPSGEAAGLHAGGGEGDDLSDVHAQSRGDGGQGPAGGSVRERDGLVVGGHLRRGGAGVELLSIEWFVVLATLEDFLHLFYGFLSGCSAVR